jgi:dTDP-D-glucose 4,6-dehydratase
VTGGSDWYDHVIDRVGHDLRYAEGFDEDPDGARLPAAVHEPGMAWPATIEWYRANTGCRDR